MHLSHNNTTKLIYMLRLCLDILKLTEWNDT